MPVIRGARVSQVVSAGAWILVPLTDDNPFPVEMQVGSAARERCLIDRDDTGRALAAKRCPELTAGRYPVKVWTPTETIETAIQVA